MILAVFILIQLEVGECSGGLSSMSKVNGLWWGLSSNPTRRLVAELESGVDLSAGLQMM